MTIDRMDTPSTNNDGQISSRFDRQWELIVAEMNKALDSQDTWGNHANPFRPFFAQEPGWVGDPRQRPKPVAESGVESPSQHLYGHHVPDDDIAFPGPHPVKQPTPAQATKFEYWTFSRSELKCRHTPCERHPPKPAQADIPKVLAVIEVKVEVKSEIHEDDVPFE